MQVTIDGEVRQPSEGTIRVAAGSTVTVRLVETDASAYRWEVREQAGLRLAGEQYWESSHAGWSGHRQFTFQIADTDGLVRFQYQRRGRAWSAPPGATQRLLIAVDR
jgi:predicted secreted protein